MRHILPAVGPKPPAISILYLKQKDCALLENQEVFINTEPTLTWDDPQLLSSWYFQALLQ